VNVRDAIMRDRKDELPLDWNRLLAVLPSSVYVGRHGKLTPSGHDHEMQDCPTLPCAQLA
jgi:hypothetical protein